MRPINVLPLVLAIVLFVVIISIFRVNCESVKESWVNYKESDFGNYHNSRGDPTVFYRLPRYRKPYRWPMCFDTLYPVSHCKHYN